MVQWMSAAGRDDFILSVNLSAGQILDESLIESVRSALDASGLSPASLLLEITETSLLEHTEEVLARIGHLRELGIRIGLDDFGTGYSSLRYLQQYPIDILKIDRSFIQQLGPEGEGGELVKTLLGLGNDLQIGVIAEGIEERFQLESLQRLHCRLGQGFELSRPLRPDAVTALLEGPGLSQGPGVLDGVVSTSPCGALSEAQPAGRSGRSVATVTSESSEPKA
jgi:EAL domain-containing protein (putative c-di-GMP-specific phosphodiesterase class I)